jgi:hypothetical protein
METRMKICSYVIKRDTGLAPNPFWGYCSLAVCTPNHQRARLSSGDWIVGNSSVSDRQRLVYAMQIDEVLGFDAYFRDPRFQQKSRIRTARSKNRLETTFTIVKEIG